jgi:hypothetical protein
LLRLRRRRGSCLDLLEVVGLAVVLQGTAWCTPHPLDSCVDLNSSSIVAITCNTNSSSSSHNSSSSSTVLLLHHRSRWQSGHHSRLPPIAFRVSTAESWDTLLMSAAYPSKAIHHKLRHPWSISRGALHHELVAWMRSQWVKKF